MAKESRPSGKGSKSPEVASGKEAAVDSGPAGEGSSGVWLNDQGDLCIGAKCFSLRLRPSDTEVRVKIDRNKCGADLQPFIDDLYTLLGKGAPTVYETVSKLEKS